MIDIKLTRKKIINFAVSGELTKGIDTNIDSIEELSKLTGSLIMNQDSNGLFELKKGWHWLKLEQLVNNSKTDFADGPFGSNLKTEHYTKEKQVRIIQLSNVGEFGWVDTNEKYTTFQHLETIKRSEVKPGNIVIAKMMPAGRAIIVPNMDCKFVLSSDCVKFVPNNLLNIKYLCYAINSDWFRQQVNSETNGIGRERTSLSKLKQYLLPMPSINEQELIVKKIDEFFLILDNIDKNQLRFKTDCVSLNLKIIEAGISGNLTEQLKSDGSAEDLYNDIQKEKEKLIKSGKIKKSKPLPEITEDEKPFDIPKNWKWVRLKEIADIRNGFTPLRGNDEYWKNGKIPWFTVEDSNVQGYFIKQDTIQHITKKAINSPERIIPADSVLLCCTASIGKSVITYVDCATNQQWNGIVKNNFYKKCILTKFIFYWTRLLKSKMLYESTATTLSFLSVGKLENFVFPLPPLAEQKRIVEKIEALLEK